MTSKIMVKHVFSLTLGEGSLHVLTGQIQSRVTAGKFPPCDPESYECMAECEKKPRPPTYSMFHVIINNKSLSSPLGGGVINKKLKKTN